MRKATPQRMCLPFMKRRMLRIEKRVKDTSGMAAIQATDSVFIGCRANNRAAIKGTPVPYSPPLVLSAALTPPVTTDKAWALWVVSRY